MPLSAVVVAVEPDHHLHGWIGHLEALRAIDGRYVGDDVVVCDEHWCADNTQLAADFAHGAVEEVRHGDAGRQVVDEDLALADRIGCAGHIIADVRAHQISDGLDGGEAGHIYDDICHALLLLNLGSE